MMMSIFLYVGNDLTQAEKQNRLNNSLFVQFTYKSLVLACFVGVCKNIDDFATTNEAFTCLRKLNLLFVDELCVFLPSQMLPKYFPSMACIDELLALVLLSDMKASKKALKQALLQFKFLDAT